MVSGCGIIDDDDWATEGVEWRRSGTMGLQRVVDDEMRLFNVIRHDF